MGSVLFVGWQTKRPETCRAFDVDREGAGRRLARILDVPYGELHRRHRFINLLKWPARRSQHPDARTAARRLLRRACPSNLTIILLGRQVADAFKANKPFFSLTVISGVQTLLLPHPSGRCRIWNDPKSVLRARAAVNALLRMPPTASSRRIQKLKKAHRLQSEWQALWATQTRARSASGLALLNLVDTSVPVSCAYLSVIVRLSCRRTFRTSSRSPVCRRSDVAA